MSLVQNFNDRKDRPAHVEFVKVPMEDKAESRKQGHYVARDIDFAHITPPYSKDIFKIEVAQWLENMTQEVAHGRMPADWEQMYRQQYDLWCQGQEMPLNGTAIKGWGIISPATQQTLIKMHIRTVEDLAGINDEGIRRIGMGAVDLKNKAVAWLAQLNDKGPLTMQMAALQKELENLKLMAQTLDEQNKKLQALIPAQPLPVAFVEPVAEITADDIIEDEPKARKGKR